MGGSVIIDDGGSTRIKTLKGAGASRMDNLLEAISVAGINQSKDYATGPFTRIRALCVRKNGTAAAPSPGGFPIAIGPGDTFEIFSKNYKIKGRILDRSAIPANHPYHPAGTAADCEIKVLAPGGIEPVLAAKHTKKERVYVVLDAPHISKVKLTAGGAPITFTIPTDTIYTAVFLLCP